MAGVERGAQEGMPLLCSILGGVVSGYLALGCALLRYVTA
jgi:hypothetical protein